MTALLALALVSETAILPLRKVDAAAVGAYLERKYPDARILVSNYSNTVIVTASTETIDRIRTLIEQIDTPMSSGRMS